MKDAWKEIERLHKVGTHNKKCKRLDSFTPTEILKHAAQELVELASEQDDVDELADTLACLIHYAIVKGWSIQHVEERIFKKLSVRIDG
jgi:hypothetical protein